MARKPRTLTPDLTAEAAAGPTDAQRAMADRRRAAEHHQLKVAFADIYVERIGLREQNTRLNEIIQEQQRVMRELSEKLPKDEPNATT